MLVWTKCWLSLSLADLLDRFMADASAQYLVLGDHPSLLRLRLRNPSYFDLNPVNVSAANYRRPDAEASPRGRLGVPGRAGYADWSQPLALENARAHCRPLDERKLKFVHAANAIGSTDEASTHRSPACLEPKPRGFSSTPGQSEHDGNIVSTVRLWDTLKHAAQDAKSAFVANGHKTWSDHVSGTTNAGAADRPRTWLTACGCGIPGMARARSSFVQLQRKIFCVARTAADRRYRKLCGYCKMVLRCGC